MDTPRQSPDLKHVVKYVKNLRKAYVKNLKTEIMCIKYFTLWLVKLICISLRTRYDAFLTLILFFGEIFTVVIINITIVFFVLLKTSHAQY